MSHLPKKLRERLSQSFFHKFCARKSIHGHECAGRITWDHALIYAGSQVQEPWAIVPVCAKGHSVDGWQDRGDYNREMHLWIALNRASEHELNEYSKAIDLLHERARLNEKYGEYNSFIENEIAY